MIVAIVLAGSRPAAADEVQLFVATPLPKAAQVALAELQAAVRSHGLNVRDATARPEADAAAIIVGTARGSTTFDELLEASKLTVSDLAESSAVAWAPDRKRTLVVAGSDERGLTYALRDAARGIAVAPHAPDGGGWAAGVTPAVESPFLRVRNVSLHLFNADCEREWFFSDEYWRFYFARLALSRFNRCTLTFCDQTNYLCPPYAYLVAMPEYPQVRVEDCTAEQREANLAMLRRITELADEYAIDFDLGIWMQAPLPKWAAPVQVTGLPEGLDLADYCALGLRRIYDACPSLDGIQLRMNAEAGVNEEQQTEFYKPLFQALADAGRPLRVELRYKGLQQATIDAAVAAGLDVTVSTKFWAEHFGLPYHPTVVDSHYAKDRYSFGTLLKKPRNYRVTYQLWTVGSQRVTLWGDPEYAARFAKSCTLSGGEGFEVFAPLTNKGYGNAPGAWQVIKDPTYRVGRWEQERYWMFYLCFGRMGYNPATNPDVWKREFRHRFGEAAKHVEEAYKSASRVLPLITAALMPSASEWSWWPEMDTGGNLAEYSRIQTSDPGQFAAIRPWDKTPDWPWEDWDARPGYLDDTISPQPSGRIDPMHMSGMLRNAGSDVAWSLAQSLEHEVHAEWRMTDVDLRILQGLADFHAAKLTAALNYSIYEREKQSSHGEAARQAMFEALRAWRRIVEAADGVYHDQLVFGVSPENTRNKFGLHHSGHWRDRLAEIEMDRLKSLPFDGTNDRPDWDLHADRFFEDAVYGKEHRPPSSYEPRTPLELRLKTSKNVDRTADGPKRIVVNVRPLDQTRSWRTLEMTSTAENDGRAWTATLPVDSLDPQFDVQYFFTLIHDKSAPENWPQPSVEQPYFVVPVATK